MKNSSKGFILLSLATVTIGVSSIMQTVAPINKVAKKNELQKYNYNSSNMLDNVFIKNNTKYLPFIYKNSEEYTSVERVKSDFAKASLTIKTIEPTEKADDGKTDIVTTNTKITVNENSNEYTVLVYGDANRRWICRFSRCTKNFATYKKS